MSNGNHAVRERERLDFSKIKSAIQIAILKAFRAAGIELSPPQDVRLIGGVPQAKNA